MIWFGLVSCRGGHQWYCDLNSDENIQALHLLIRYELLETEFVFKPERYQTRSVANVYDSFENTGKKRKW